MSGREGGGETLHGEMRAFLDRWQRSIVAKDIDAARALRTGDYLCTAPDGSTLTREQELETIASELNVAGLRTRLVAVEDKGDGVVLRFDLDFRAEGTGDGTPGAYRAEMRLVRSEGGWQARSMAVEPLYAVPGAEPRTPIATLRRLGGRLLRRARMTVDRRAASFQTLAYLPYRPGRDYALEESEPPVACFDEAGLPVPPPELWLGYNYPVHGALHVGKMMEIVEAGGFAFAAGDRLLDLGCGAGRMIRHLAPLAETREIWGADISAEHILWCQRHLSPPFHFLTSTKVPHLPFADGSFRFVYCGSLFTHIDDLARAWLIELRRLLRDDGCAYVTLHDEETVRQFEAYRSPPAIVREIMASPTFAAAKGRSDMFTIGRDDRSQVFYSRPWFERMLAPMFEIVSVNPGAYFYQTAFLIRPR